VWHQAQAGASAADQNQNQKPSIQSSCLDPLKHSRRLAGIDRVDVLLYVPEAAVRPRPLRDLHVPAHRRVIACVLVPVAVVRPQSLQHRKVALLRHKLARVFLVTLRFGFSSLQLPSNPTERHTAQ
jgi:hypothetical protein